MRFTLDELLRVPVLADPGDVASLPLLGLIGVLAMPLANAFSPNVVQRPAEDTGSTSRLASNSPICSARASSVPNVAGTDPSTAFGLVAR